MPARLAPTPEEIATLQRLLANPQNTQQSVADLLGWPVRRIERLRLRLNLPVHSCGRFRGPADGRWKTGRIVDRDGYVLLWCPDHPHGRKHTAYVLEHRLVVEEALHRYLRSGEVVHHRNKNKQDNRLENLVLFQSNADHLREELTGHRPQWTEAGKARIQAGYLKRSANRKLSARDGTLPPRKKNRSTP